MLMTVSFEGIFLVVFYNLLQLWIELRTQESNEAINKALPKQETKKFSLQGKEVIDIVLYLYFSFGSFFSTGNVASFNGFTMSSFFRFTKKYLPLVIILLLGIKILIPFILVTTAFNFICKKNQISSTNSFFVIISLCDINSIIFFFLVNDSGSWAEIGMNIAFFSIGNIFCLLQIGLILFVNFLFWVHGFSNEYINIEDNPISSLTVI